MKTNKRRIIVASIAAMMLLTGCNSKENDNPNVEQPGNGEVSISSTGGKTYTVAELKAEFDTLLRSITNAVYV